MRMFTSPHKHILLVHFVIQIKVGVITIPFTNRLPETSWSRNSSQLFWFSRPHEGLAKYECYMKTVLCLFLVMLMMLPRWGVKRWALDFLSFPHQCLLNEVNVLWWSHRLVTNNTLSYCWSHSQSLQSNLFSADLVGIFLCSNFIQNSCWTTITLTAW
jgi:hypothetical protein